MQSTVCPGPSRDLFQPEIIGSMVKIATPLVHGKVKETGANSLRKRGSVRPYSAPTASALSRFLSCAAPARHKIPIHHACTMQVKDAAVSKTTS